MIFAAMTCGCAHAAQYHVSPQGDDSNPGTAAKPWRTIARVNQAGLTPGDRVLFEGGATFAGTIELGPTDSGGPGAKVEIGSYGEGRATIYAGDGAGLLARGCSHLVIRNIDFVGSGRKSGNTRSGVDVSDGEDIVVDQVEVSGFRSSGVVFRGVIAGRITNVHAHNNGADGISVSHGARPRRRWSEDITIANCVAENNPGDPSNLTNHSGSGIVVGHVRGCTIEYCEAMDNGWDMPRTGNGPVGIWAWNADRVVIQFCVARNNRSPGHDGGGFDFDGGVTNSIMQYNLSYENEGPGYLLCQYPGGPVWKNNIVRYNISVNDGLKNNLGCGIEVWNLDARFSDAEVYNNVVYNAKGGAVGFGGLPAPRIRFRNNIFISTGELIRGDHSPARFEGNWYWSLDGEFQVGDHRSLEAWAEATGQERSGRTMLGGYGDPRLVDAGAVPDLRPDALATLKAYRLLPDSPCLGAGIPIKDNGGRDFWGAPLVPGERPSIGACERP